MKASLKYYSSADAAYIYLDDSAEVDSTLEVDEDINIDLDADKKIVGIELLHAKQKLKLPQISPENN